jgi:addiction module RelE/StbE family toxin
VAAVRLSSQASKDFEKLARSDRQIFERVDAALTRLVEEPTAGKPLQGPLAGLRSLRVGDLRIIYRHDAAQLLIFVLDIARRDKAYRRSESTSGATARAETPRHDLGCRAGHKRPAGTLTHGAFSSAFSEHPARQGCSRGDGRLIGAIDTNEATPTSPSLHGRRPQGRPSIFRSSVCSGLTVGAAIPLLPGCARRELHPLASARWLTPERRPPRWTPRGR